VIAPAVCGVKFILKSAAKHKVKKVVITSSVATVAYSGITKDRIDETVWTDLKSTVLSAEIKSKVLSERAVWDFKNC